LPPFIHSGEFRKLKPAIDFHPLVTSLNLGSTRSATPPPNACPDQERHHSCGASGASDGAGVGFAGRGFENGGRVTVVVAGRGGGSAVAGGRQGSHGAFRHLRCFSAGLGKVQPLFQTSATLFQGAPREGGQRPAAGQSLEEGRGGAPLCSRWRSIPSGKCSQGRLTWGTLTSTMRRAAHPSGCARCSAGAGRSAIEWSAPPRRRVPGRARA